MRNLSDNNPNIDMTIEDIFAKDVPHARQTLIMDVFSFNYTFLVTANDKSKLEITLKYSLFANSGSVSQDTIQQILKEITPGATKDAISIKPTQDCIVFTVDIPKARECLKEVREFLSDFTISFITKSILIIGKKPTIFLIDDHSTLFFEEKEENYLLVFGYRGKNTLDKYLLRSMATEISNQRARRAGGCPSVSYVDPAAETKSSSTVLLKNYKSEQIKSCDSGFISFYINKKESTAKEKVMKTIRLKTFLDFQMKGLRTMMNGKMRGAGSMLGKVLARTTIVP
eukprot:GAHX01000288.1.p1 GENE.GAHX01000288.1~~GAHX01000288.1.p1  ORF type:complete len:285 (+),score=56.51 GAHX01000288.1:44-898(+)